MKIKVLLLDVIIFLRLIKLSSLYEFYNYNISFSPFDLFNILSNILGIITISFFSISFGKTIKVEFTGHFKNRARTSQSEEDKFTRQQRRIQGRIVQSQLDRIQPRLHFGRKAPRKIPRECISKKRTAQFNKDNNVKSTCAFFARECVSNNRDTFTLHIMTR